MSLVHVPLRISQCMGHVSASLRHALLSAILLLRSQQYCCKLAKGACWGWGCSGQLSHSCTR